MPSSEYDLSVDRLLLIIVFQLGFCMMLLARITDGTQGYETSLGLVGYLIGALTMIGALGALFERH